MRMLNVTQTENVIIPSIWRSQRLGVRIMVDVTKAALDSPRVNTVLSGLAAAGTFVVLIGAVVGWLTIGATGAHDLIQLREQNQASNNALRDQITALTATVNTLSAKIDQGPRLDQLQMIDRHLSALDGRMDGMDARSRADEDRLTRTETRVEGIDQASRAGLGAGRK